MWHTILRRLGSRSFSKPRSRNRQAGARTRWRFRPVVESLEGRTVPATHFALSGFPTAITAGVAANITITAENADNSTDTAYYSWFHFTSSDGWAVLPEASFLSNGVGTFSVTLQTAGPQSITVTDASNATITGTLSGITVNPAATAKLVLGGLASPVTAGTAHAMTVTAEDAFGNTTPGYTGTVHFTSSDPNAVLPADSTLTNGTGTFNVTLKTAGTQLVTATDTVNAGITGTLSDLPSQPVAVYASIPNPAGGYDKSAWYAPDGLDGDQYVWDSFVLSSNQTINEIRWRGCYTNYLSGAGKSPVYDFTVSIYGSIGAYTQPDLTAPPLATWDSAGNAGETAVGVFGGVQMYDYRFALPTAFRAAAGTEYWVQIEAWQGVTPTYGWPPDWSLAYGTGDDSAHFREIIGGSLAGGNAYQGVAGEIAYSLLTSVPTAGVVVNPAATSQLVVTGYPTSATAGAGGPVTATAKDAFGNTTPGYTGTVHFTSTDPQAALPANSTLTAGVGTFNVTLKTAGTQSITATDTAHGNITGSESGIAVSPGATSQFLVSGFPSSAVAGVAGLVTVKAADAYGNTTPAFTDTVNITSSDQLAVLPAPGTLANGVGTFAVTLNTVGTQSITATDAASAGILGSQSGISVVATATPSFVVSRFPTVTTAGVVQSFTVTAYNADGTKATGYRGTVHFTSGDGQAALPGDYTFTAGDAGTHPFTAALKMAGTQYITVTDTANPAMAGMQSGIVVNPAAANRLAVSGLPVTTVAGTVQTFTVTALDPYGNTATGYLGTVKFTSSDPKAVKPANHTFTAAEQGVQSFTAALETAGAQSVTTTDTVKGSITGTAGLTVTPAAAAVLVVSGFPSPTTAGDSHAFTVTAKDAYGNTATGYQGTVHFTSGDTKAVLPANYAFTPFDAGVHGFSATLKTAGGKTLTATDTVTKTLTGKQTVTVQAAAATHFKFTEAATVTAGTPFSVTVTALDAYGNTASGYQGTVRFTSTDAQAVLPANYTFLAAEKGKHTFPGVVLKTAGSRKVTVLDTANTSVAGVATTTVNPAAAVALVVSGFPATATHGVAYSFTVTAVDAYGNVATGYRGKIHFTSSDGAALLPADYTLLAGDKGQHTFTATLSTLGLQSVTATDTVTASITGTEGGITVV
jgi:hypothetical protein